MRARPHDALAPSCARRARFFCLRLQPAHEFNLSDAHTTPPFVLFNTQEAPKYPWMKKRDKAMPWTLAGGSSCDLFDYTCSAKEKAAKAALAEE